MNAFPLIRVRWSNEHIMTAVFGVTILYLLPRWVLNPVLIVDFVLVLVIGLLMDVIINFIRYKALICGVSAAVTVAIFQALTPDLPRWGSFLGITMALLVGKHLWGGTGKNLFNPALIGVVLISLIFDIKLPLFPVTFLMIPALILSIPLMKMRPYAALGLMTGLLLMLHLTVELSLTSIISYGVLFWGCLIVTDPVTVSSKPWAGLLGGFASALVPLWLTNRLLGLTLGVLGLNAVSALVEFLSVKSESHLPLKIAKVAPFSKEKTEFRDLAETNVRPVAEIPVGNPVEILKKIAAADVFGYGGAGFPVYQKIQTVIESKSLEKHLIINGVECDPGLIHDQWLLYHHPEKVYQGIQILNQCWPFSSITLAVKDARELSVPKELSIHCASNYYPAGAEKTLINEVLHKTIPPEIIPAAEGILVLNVQTVYAIAEVVTSNQKLNTRFLTVLNMFEKTGIVARVELGMTVQEVVNKIYPHYNGPIFVGGGLMQSHRIEENEIIDKMVNFIAIADGPRYKESPLCSKCGRCSEHCPAGLEVRKTIGLFNQQKYGKLEKYHPEKCLSCGSCSYLCPAGRNLASQMNLAKKYVMVNNK